MVFKVGIGQDSHRFVTGVSSKECVIAGLVFDDAPGFQANSDGDVAIHAICNAISSITKVPILGGIADDLCLKNGITDSSVYLQEALNTLNGAEIVHVALTLEGKKPKFFDHLDKMCASLAEMMSIQPSQVGITATSGEGLTDFGRGDGVQCIAIVTVNG